MSVAIVNERLGRVERLLHHFEDVDLILDWKKNHRSRSCHLRTARYYHGVIKARVESAVTRVTGPSELGIQSIVERAKRMGERFVSDVCTCLDDDITDPRETIVRAMLGVLRVRAEAADLQHEIRRRNLLDLPREA